MTAISGAKHSFLRSGEVRLQAELPAAFRTTLKEVVRFATEFSELSGTRRKAWVLMLLCSTTAIAAPVPDTTQTQRRHTTLSSAAAGFVPLRAYNKGESDRSDCVIIGDDGFRLVARLELNKRGLAGGASPLEAAPWAQHIAESLWTLVGPSAAGRCAWAKSGAPGVMNAYLSVAYALHRYGAGWSPTVRDTIHRTIRDVNFGSNKPVSVLINADISIIAGELLAGEAVGDTALVQRGRAHLRAVVDATARQGGVELNSPLYTSAHLGPLAAVMTLRDSSARSLARILLEYELLLQAHFYLPGGGLGAPQSRDYAGGTGDGGDRALLASLFLLHGDPSLTLNLATAYSGAAFLAATDYVLPEAIRTVFLDKGGGYEARVRTPVTQGTAKTPNAYYSLGTGGAPVAPWHVVVTPNGQAELGVSYGFTAQPLYVSFGVYARRPTGGFAILYQYQPRVCGDTNDIGDVVTCGSSAGYNADADDFKGEGYDYERLVYGRTAISLWDPLPRPGVLRTFPDTRVSLPDWTALGGEETRAGEWRVGRLAQTYIAYRPLGTISVEQDRGDWRYLRLSGRSGCIVELATTSEFPTLAAYAADLAGRKVSFSSSPLAAEFDAREPKSGNKVRVRLEYRAERRVVAGAEITAEQAMGKELLSSPWLNWDETTKRLRFSRPGLETTIYDWASGTVSTSAPSLTIPRGPLDFTVQ